VDAAPGWDRWVSSARWTPDGALVVTADEDGRAPVFRLEGGPEGRHGHPADRRPRRLHRPRRLPRRRARLRAAQRGRRPAGAVRLDARAAGQQPVALPAPGPAPELPGTLTEVTTTAEDGTALRAWLVLPDGAHGGAPAPLLLWIHGGPLGSWNAWQWRWNPWLMAARGWAVLLPDPALSTGYGRGFVERGWGAWGAAPYTDLMALTDAAQARDDVDAARTAAMGGSFGGYMANWVAGHTDRFAAIVTHASLWSLDRFGPHDRRPVVLAAGDDRGDDAGAQPAPPRRRDHHAGAGRARRQGLPGARRGGARAVVGPRVRVRRRSRDLPHRFLYFPDENHWILTPGNAALWYATVHAFLDHHVLGRPWEVPDLLR
jgi:dipeptidyl aminopeptidase/acylaminoacyl peptidase